MLSPSRTPSTSATPLAVLTQLSPSSSPPEVLNTPTANPLTLIAPNALQALRAFQASNPLSASPLPSPLPTPLISRRSQRNSPKISTPYPTRKPSPRNSQRKGSLHLHDPEAASLSIPPLRYFQQPQNEAAEANMQLSNEALNA